MATDEYTPAKIREFKGIFARGKVDTCPPDHFIDSLNMWFTESGVETRPGTSRILSTGTIKRIFTYKRINEAARLLVLDNTGKLFDAAISLSIPILDIAAMTDFSAVNIYNRCYISPHNGTKGLANEFVYVYDGSIMRKAAGSPPTGTLGVAHGGAGNIETGFHYFAVVFETASGFLSKPGPIVFGLALEDGTKGVDLSAIPTGPTGVVTRRYIIATKSIPEADWNGNQFGHEYFFIPDAVINDNVTTTLSVNFYDADLTESADYLFNILPEIPAGLVLSTYKTRMVVGNFDGNQFLMRVSSSAEPEVFDEVGSVLVVDPTEAGGVTNTVEYRDLLGITKSLRSYLTQENGGEPNTWEVIILDKGNGTEVHGISTILDSTGSHSDRFFIACRSGLILFDGSYKHPEMSWKIQNIWERINQSYFHTIQLAYDPINEHVFVAVPLDAATVPSHILFADLSAGWTADEVMWNVWSFPWNTTSVIIDVVNNMPVLKIGSSSVYKLDPTATNDNGGDSGVAIQSYVKFALLPNSSSGMINHFNMFSARISGVGSIVPELRGEDDSGQMLPPPFILESLPGKEYTRLINFVGEKMSLKLSLTSIDEKFAINNLVIYHAPLWAMRPL